MKLRSFIAVEIPADIHRAIMRSMASMQRALPKPLIRWVESQNIHLTLKFLGDVSPVNLDQLADALKVELASHASFNISVGGLGAFPNSHRPRIIWVGLEAPIALTTLQRTVDTIAARMGYVPEEHPFSPHLTIGRVGQGVTSADLLRIQAAFDATTVGNLGEVHVESVHIFKSDLQPGGSVYTHLYTLPMKL